MAEVTVKSAEQKLIEKATEEYLQKLQAILTNRVEIEVGISYVNLSKLGHIAECAGIGIDKRSDSIMPGGSLHYIRKPFSGEGYTITEISE